MRADQDILPSVEFVSNRGALDGAAAVRMPERLAGLRIERENVAVIVGGENQTARRAQHASPVISRSEIVRPANLSRLVIDCF